MMYPIFKTALLTGFMLVATKSGSFFKDPKPTTFSIKIKLENIIVNKGEIYLALYDRETNFMVKYKRKRKITVKEKSQVIVFNNLPKGDYSVTVFQDLNGNKKLDKFMSIPTEPYGISNNPNGYPTFSNSKVTLKSNKTINIKIKN